MMIVFWSWSCSPPNCGAAFGFAEVGRRCPIGEWPRSLVKVRREFLRKISGSGRDRFAAQARSPRPGAGEPGPSCSFTPPDTFNHACLMPSTPSGDLGSHPNSCRVKALRVPVQATTAATRVMTGRRLRSDRKPQLRTDADMPCIEEAPIPQSVRPSATFVAIVQTFAIGSGDTIGGKARLGQAETAERT